MKTKILLVLTLLLITYSVRAQTIATNETKIIVVVKKAENTINKLVYYNTFKDLSHQDKEKKYPKCAFYLGLLKGKYSIDNDELELGNEATLTVYTNKQYHPKDGTLSSKDLKLGVSVQIGNAKTLVVTNKEGEITLTTEQ